MDTVNKMAKDMMSDKDMKGFKLIVSSIWTLSTPVRNGKSARIPRDERASAARVRRRGHAAWSAESPLAPARAALPCRMTWARSVLARVAPRPGDEQELQGQPRP